MLLTIGDLEFSKLDFGYTCTYMEKESAPNTDSRKYLLELKTYCNKIKPFVTYYSKLIQSYNKTTYNILENEIRLLLPLVPKRQKCGIITTLISSFIGLAHEGISCFLQWKCKNALHKAVNAMNNQANTQHNKLMKLDDMMLMYGIYNAETLEKLIRTVHEIHNTTSLHERLFAGEHNHSLFRLLYTDALGIQQYATNSLLYLGIIQDKYISLYRELIAQLHTYVSAIRILAKGYLPNTLIKPKRLHEILTEVKKSLHNSNPDYNLVLDRLHLYYGMQLVTFGIDKDMNLIIQFPVFIQPYTQKPLILYQLETVPIPVLDRNTKAQSYTHLRIEKPYIALNSETYISFYCKELFVVKHKSSYSCESAIYFNLMADIIKSNHDFDFYFNKPDVTPALLDGGDEIVLANWPNDKHIICNINNDIPIKIPSHPYVLVNRSVLCNCRIEADNHHLLESIATCDNKISKLIMYFPFNLAFTNYLYMLPNLNDSLPLIKDRTRYEQPLPLNLSIPNFELEQRHAVVSLNKSNKNFFSNYIVDIFTFTSSCYGLFSYMLM